MMIRIGRMVQDKNHRVGFGVFSLKSARVPRCTPSHAGVGSPSGRLAECNKPQKGQCGKAIHRCGECSSLSRSHFTQDLSTQYHMQWNNLLLGIVTSCEACMESQPSVANLQDHQVQQDNVNAKLLLGAPYVGSSLLQK